jgi:hypothetical protein
MSVWQLSLMRYWPGQTEQGGTISQLSCGQAERIVGWEKVPLMLTFQEPE